MTKEKITANVQKLPHGYQGYITIWCGTARIYDDYCIPLRVSVLDAHSDALRAKSELENV